MTPSRGRARIGALVPFTNSNLEPDLQILAPEGVSIHIARMGGYDADEIPDAAQMQGLGASDLDQPLTLLQGVQPDVILYGCTSATLTHGPTFDRNLSERISTDSGAQTVTAAGALVAALHALGASRIAFASPYVPAINDMATDFLSKQGFATVGRADVTDILDNTGQGAMPPPEVYALGRRADVAQAHALVLSCTDMRSVEVIASLEQDLGKPVVTSNQAMMFAACQALGLDDPIAGFGRLLSHTPRIRT